MKKKILTQKSPHYINKKLHSIKFTPASLNNSGVFNSKWMLPILSLGLLILFFTIRKIANLDTGFHLAAGRWILTNFSVPVKDIFTYTVSQNEYIDIQWLYQVLIYAFYLFFNYTGLTIFNTLVIGCVFYLLLKKMNLYGVPVFLSLILLFVTVISIQLRFGYRPEIVTWLFMLCSLFILERYYYFGKAKLYLLPVIMLLWVNMHGLFILGLMITGVYLVSISINKKSIDKNLLKWFLISIASVFINPYFTEGVMFPFYLFTRLQKGNIFQQNITELQPPWGMAGDAGLELYLYYVISIISFILLVITYRKRALHQFVLLAAFFYISYSSFRNIPVFILYAVYIIAICLSDVLNNESVKRSIEIVSRYEKYFKIIFSVTLLLICIRIFTGAYYRNYNSEIKSGTGVDETILPEQTADFINSNSLRGNILNNLELGGWLDWKTKLPVFIDGRLEVIKEDFYKEYLTSFTNNGISKLSQKYNADLVINDISNFDWTSQMNEIKKDWRLIHWDQTASVYAKNGSADKIILDSSYAVTSMNIDTNVLTGSVKDEIIMSGHIENTADWLSGFYSNKIKPVEFMRMGNFAFDVSQYRHAEIFYLYFIKNSSGSLDKLNYADVYNNLGSVYYLLNDYPRSLNCYERFLQIKYDVQIKNRVNELKRRLGQN
ncbi:MAG: tetratricopeptide repeat-containing protein [Ignavibacteria bacterium]|nr:tetratricopeptide repeat-containing protein [Ignavibacteria bacterium]